MDATTLGVEVLGRNRRITRYFRSLQYHGRAVIVRGNPPQNATTHRVRFSRLGTLGAIVHRLATINRHIVELHLHTRKHLKNPVTLGLADGHRTGRVYLLNDVSVLGLSQVQVTV